MTKKELIDLYKEKRSIRGVADVLGVSVTTAWKYLKDAGVNTKKQKKVIIE